MSSQSVPERRDAGTQSSLGVMNDLPKRMMGKQQRPEVPPRVVSPTHLGDHITIVYKRFTATNVNLQALTHVGRSMGCSCSK